MHRKTRVEPPGNGLELDLVTLTDIVLDTPYGVSIPTAEFRHHLREGGANYYERVHDAIIEDPEDEPLVQAELERLYEFVDELLRLKPVVEDSAQLAFERWLAAAVETFIDEYGPEEDRELLLFKTEEWGLVPSDSAERECEIPLTRAALSEAMSALPELPADQREYVNAGRNDLIPFQPRGNALDPDGPAMMMLRRLAILPSEWDHIYGAILERLADDFCGHFYPALRWMILDPEEVCSFYGDRVDIELLPGFQELFSTLLRDVLTIAVNQVARYAKGERPGTGPGMREFPWTTTHRYSK